MTPLAAWTMEKAGQVADTGLGMLLGGLQDKRQRRQQQKLQDMQIAGNKQMIDYQMQKQLEMWKNTNYSAQVGELEKAGLNSGLIYGMSGGGGTTTGNASGGVTGSSAAGHSGEPQAMMGLGIQRGMMQAQLDLIKAQTEKTKAEAIKTAGVDTQETSTRIDSLRAGITNTTALEQMTRVETALKNIELYEQQRSQEDRMDYIAFQTGRAMQELEKAMAESYVARETQNEKVEIIRQEAIGAVLKNTLTEANINATNEQINKWKAEISQNWRGLDQKDLEIAIKGFEAELKATFPGIGSTIGRVLNDAIESIFKITHVERLKHYKSPKK